MLRKIFSAIVACLTGTKFIKVYIFNTILLDTLLNIIPDKSMRANIVVSDDITLQHAQTYRVGCASIKGSIGGVKLEIMLVRPVGSVPLLDKQTGFSCWHSN